MVKTKYIIYALLLSITFLIPLSCYESPSTPIDKPEYTADQVVTVAKAQFTSCFKREMVGQDAGGIMRYHTVETPTIISAQYLGDSRWQVKIICSPGYRLIDPYNTVTSATLYFYESDGTLRQH